MAVWVVRCPLGFVTGTNEQATQAEDGGGSYAAGQSLFRVISLYNDVDIFE